MYNVPSFTLARSIGGLFSWYWVQVLRRSNTPLIILASVSDPKCTSDPTCPSADCVKGIYSWGRLPQYPQLDLTGHAGASSLDRKIDYLWL